MTSPEHTESNFLNNNSEFLKEEIPFFFVCSNAINFFIICNAYGRNFHNNNEQKGRKKATLPYTSENSEDLPLFVTQVSILVYSFFTQNVKVSSKLKAICRAPIL